MKTSAQLNVALIVCATLLCSVYAQIPTACIDATSLGELTCCPVASTSVADGVCGENSNRGQCVSLNLPNHSNTTTDVRRNFPHYYIRACQCNGNFAGISCERCKFGYYGDNCEQYQVRVRPSVADFTDANWTEYNRILGLTRTFVSSYTAVLEETYPGNTTLRTRSGLTIYQMFVWMHHYASKDSLRQVDPVDYAHTAPGFSTWHRLHGLWFEWEIQNMLKNLGDTDYHMFRLPVWDWRQRYQKSTGLGASDLFVANRAGATKNVSGRAVVTGDLYGDEGWQTLCWRRIGQICDPTEDTDLLQRCPFTGTDPCSTDNPDWPTQSMVDFALATPVYDVPPYNIQSIGGYRATVDFAVGLLLPPACADDRQCRCVPSGNPLCTDIGEISMKSGMHLLGHIIIGQGDFNFLLNNDQSTIGTFEDVAASPNDPVFILHHNMIDCILGGWMSLNPGAEYPTGVETTGHAKDGFVVPFFPLYTHNDIFTMSDEQGYFCSLPEIPTDSAMVTTVSSGLVLLLGLIVFALN